MTTPAVEALCPHCKKPFMADLLGPDTERAGSKCPHCKLFVPLERGERAAEPEPADTAA
jgi:DNA-directed RNA polymerase subunit RPC12/RpoP